MTVDSGAGRRAGAAGRPTTQEQAGVTIDARSRAEHVSRLLLISLSNRRNRKIDMNTVIKNERIASLLEAGPRRGVSGRTTYE